MSISIKRLIYKHILKLHKKYRLFEKNLLKVVTLSCNFYSNCNTL
jgi:hypothetical protein